ncbi:MAG: metal-dependent hydrolase [Halobacteriales archaeon]|nr:metal-dependent hydrolase [Halobacteriales archaeon]
MMIGHALVAFAIAAGSAGYRRWARADALAVGLLAAAFAMAPDVDMLYAIIGVLRVGMADVWTVTDAFWSTGNVIHRAVTHSLLAGSVTAVAVTLIATGRAGVIDAGARFDRRLIGIAVGVGLLGTLVVAALLEGGVLAATVMAAFAIAGTVIARFGLDRLELSPWIVLLAALVGLLSHPFGDLFTGEPPLFLYPLDITLITERIALHPDPTLHLLGTFGLELAAAWVAILVFFRLSGGSLRRSIDLRASIGIPYAAVALALPAPTLEVSYHFVFSILAVGLLGIVTAAISPLRRVRRLSLPQIRRWSLSIDSILQATDAQRSRLSFGDWLALQPSAIRAFVTGVATVTVAAIAYTAVYVTVTIVL